MTSNNIKQTLPNCNVDHGVQDQQPLPHNHVKQTGHKDYTSENRTEKVQGKQSAENEKENQDNVILIEPILKTKVLNDRTASIDSMLPQPQPLDSIILAENEVLGGMDGGCQEETTNLQEGVSNGGNCLMFCMRKWLTLGLTLEPLNADSNFSLQQ